MADHLGHHRSAISAPGSLNARSTGDGLARFERSPCRVFRHAKNAVMKAGLNAYKDRRTKKRNYRALWILRISAAVKELGYNYSRFQFALTKNMVILNRKVLSNLAVTNPEIFKDVVEKVMK